MAAPIVIYLETNWLVSSVLPHHPWQADALALLGAEQQARCEIRIPEVAFLEARHVVERETQAHGKAIATAAESLAAAATNLGRAELRKLAQELARAEQSYRLANPREALDKFTEKCRRFAFANPIKEQELLDQLRGQIAMRGGDITDLHILMAVAANRDLEGSGPSRPAAFLSTNSSEFAVHGSSAKIPRDFYAVRRLVYLDKFNLAGAVRKWDKEDASGWVAPTAPQTDPRLQEAQRLLYGLSDDKRDQAVEALKAILATPP